MEEQKLLEIFVQIRKTYNLLGEVMDLSKQMAESLDRDDSMAFQMVLSMRREPIGELAITRERIQQLLQELPVSDAEQMKNILNGGIGQTPLEKKMEEQIGSNNRLFRQISDLDQRLNEKIAHEQSIYHNY